MLISPRFLKKMYLYFGQQREVYTFKSAFNFPLSYLYIFTRKNCYVFPKNFGRAIISKVSIASLFPFNYLEICHYLISYVWSSHRCDPILFGHVSRYHILLGLVFLSFFTKILYDLSHVYRKNPLFHFDEN